MSAIVPQWDSTDDFPPTSMALRDPNGLLAVGGDLSVPRLLRAYRRGIFPWYDAEQPILWWSPDPRMVLIPGQEHCSRSMNKLMRRSQWRIRIDQQFSNVVKGCADPRNDQSGTWISRAMERAYNALHMEGYAHSIEVLDQNDHLLGGLYGIALGRVFFGESMFSRVPNASKMAFICLSRWLADAQFELIDCQVANPHLVSLGAREIPRYQFEEILHLNTTAALIDSGQAFWREVNGNAITYHRHIVT